MKEYIFITLFILCTGVVNAALTDGLVAYYAFDDLAATDSVGNYDGKLYSENNEISLIPGKIGNAYKFTFDTPYELNQVDTGYSPDTSEVFTIAHWVKFSTSGFGLTFGCRNYHSTGSVMYGVYQNSGLILTAIFDSSDKSSSSNPTTFNDNQWHFVIAEYNNPADILGLWIDGSDYSDPVTISQYNPACTLQIGGLDVKNGYNYPFNGQIDEFMIYERALSNEEKIELYSIYNSGNRIIYIPETHNILKNSEFNGSSNWVFYTNAVGSFTTPSNIGQISLTTIGSNMQLYQYNVPITSGKKYKLIFDANSNNGKDLNFYLQQHNSPYANIGLSETFNLGTSKQTFAKTFTATKTENNSRLRIGFQATPGTTYWIDNIELRENNNAGSAEVCDGIDNDLDGLIDEGYISTPTSCGIGECAATGQLNCVNGAEVNTCTAGTPTTEVCNDNKDNDCDGQVDEGCSVVINLIKNPEFNGSSNWIFYTNAVGTFSTADNTGKVTLKTIGSNMQLYQYNIPITSGKTYKLTFDAKSSNGNDFNIYLSQHNSPYASVGLSETFNLETSIKTFTKTFTATKTETNGRLRIAFPTTTTPGTIYWIDNIKLEKTS